MNRSHTTLLPARAEVASAAGARNPTHHLPKPTLLPSEAGVTDAHHRRARSAFLCWPRHGLHGGLVLNNHPG
jgi:hypothetical protein